jgi:Uma2 family endonuclease
MSIDPQQEDLHPGGLMSEEQYLHLDGSTYDARYEYIDGVARLLAGGSVAHDRITYNTRSALEQHFLSGPCTVFGSDMQVLVGVKSSRKKHYCYPDVTVSCDVADRQPNNTLIQSPRIVVEILSAGTEAIDRGKKLAAYKACPSMQEIVLISQFAPRVEVYRRDEEDDAWDYIIYEPGSDIELRSVDVRLSLKEIYKGISFDEFLLEE